MRLRVLPIAIALTVFGIGIRTVDIVSLAISGDSFNAVTPVNAEPAKGADAAPAASPEPAAAKTQVATSEAPGSLAAMHMPDTVPSESKTAPDLLAALASKRKDLDARQQELDQRQALLQAAEDRINKKVEQLSTMRSDLEKLLDLQKTKDAAQIASLVKIYENMKPGDAAAIFNNLEGSVLIDVSSRMKEAKVAPILAAMDPARARLLTVKLAEHRKVMEGAVANAQAALGTDVPPDAAPAPADAPK
jgi:flagellar motility protein MotE (MotC chaperone)